MRDGIVNGSTEYSIKDVLTMVYIQFRITVVYQDPENFLTSEDKAVINSCVDFWQKTIKRTLPEKTYDLKINFIMEVNEPNVLGGASVVNVRTVNSKIIPYEGRVYINSTNWNQLVDDVKNNGETTAYRTIVHEIGHLLGLGTVWTANNLVEDDFWYVGENGLREYRNRFGDQTFEAIPLEDDGGPGSAQGHFEEGTQHGISMDNRYKNGKFYPGLDRDLMSAFAETDDGPEPLGKVTLGMLQDLGYSVRF